MEGIANSYVSRGGTGNNKDSKIADFLLFYNENEANNPGAYESSYSQLSKWIDQIDVYQLELRRVLFPLFVHSYLDLVSKGLKSNAQQFMAAFGQHHVENFGVDVARLDALVEPEQIPTSEFAQNYRNFKYAVKMSQYSFELLLCFLQDNKFMLLLRILNQYVSIQATREKPGVDQKEDDPGAGLVNVGSIDDFNEQPVKLGALPPDISFLSNVVKILEAKNQDAELKSDLQQLINAPIDENAPSRDNVPQEPKSFLFNIRRMIDVEAEIERIRDARERLKLSPAALPSICCYTFMNTYNSINCLKTTSKGDMVVSGSSDSIVRLWDTKDAQNSSTRSPPTQLIGHSGPVFGVDISPDSRYILSGSEDKTARLWSAETKKQLVVYKGHNFPIFDVAFGPNGFYFATASHDRTARLWSCDHIFPLRIFVGHVSDVECVAFHPNSNYVVTGSADMTARLFDVQRGSCVRIFARHQASVQSVAISPDGRLLATGGEDKLIKLWDLGSGRKIKTLTGHNGPVFSLAFSRDNSMLASGSSDDTVRLWNTLTSETESVQTVESNDLLGSYPTKRTPILSVEFSPRNLLFALGVFQP